MHTDKQVPLFVRDGYGSRFGNVEIEFEEKRFSVPEGVSVAAALLCNGVTVCRQTAISGAPRAPYCMMGVCFECLVNIDGLPARQACLTTVKNGMRVSRQRGASELAASVDGDEDAE